MFQLFCKGGPRQGWLCVLGGFLCCLSFSSDFSYPNINSYLTSYMRNNQTNGYNNDLTYDDFVFLTTTKVVIQGASMPFVGDLCRRLGVKRAIAIGSAVYSLGFISTWWTVKYYFALAVVSLSMHGLGFSFIYATAIGAAQKWFPRSKKGLIGSIVLSGYGYGSLLWSPLQTAYVNPNNVKAVKDPRCGGLNETETDYTDYDCKNRYYVDQDMLDRVPWMFLILGVCFSVLGFLSVLLISEPDESPSETLSLRSDSETVSENQIQTSLKPTKVLRTATFYQIWVGFFSIGLCNGLMSTYSKTFGLTFLNDDHFYAILAIFLNIFNGSCRIFWGFSYDKLGFKICFLVIGAAVTIVTMCLPALPVALNHESDGAKAGYGIAMIILYSTFPGIYAIVAAGVNEAFGPVHYKANFGLLFTQSLAYCAVILTMTKVPLFHQYLGYMGMFFVAGGFGVIGILVACFLPRHLSSLQYQYNVE